MPSAVASVCAEEQGKFWEMHDKMFENQRALEDADLENYAKQIGLDINRWKKCYTEGTPKNRIMQEQATAMRLGARGTPAFFINGRFLSGAQPFPAFDALVGEELKKAQSSGLPKGEYYQKAVVEKGEKKV
jgi:protein-disulfide isomerase